jgi:hypothetical protein
MVRDAREWVGRNVFQVPEGQDQPLPVSQPPRHAQGQGDGRTKQLPRTDGGARRRPQGEGEAKPPHDGTSHQSQSDGRTEPPPKYRPKLVEKVQRFVKTAPGVEETPEREWKAQRMFSLCLLRVFLLRPPILLLLLSDLRFPFYLYALFYFNLYVLLYQLVCATYTPFSLFCLSFFFTSFCALFFTFLPVSLPPPLSTCPPFLSLDLRLSLHPHLLCLLTPFIPSFLPISFFASELKS